MGVASGCGEQEVGVASGSGWNLWVWLLGVVVRRYIGFLILLIPTPLVFFFTAASLLFVRFLNVFCLLLSEINIHQMRRDQPVSESKEEAERKKERRPEIRISYVPGSKAICCTFSNVILLFGYIPNSCTNFVIFN